MSRSGHLVPTASDFILGGSQRHRQIHHLELSAFGNIDPVSMEEAEVLKHSPRVGDVIACAGIRDQSPERLSGDRCCGAQQAAS